MLVFKNKKMSRFKAYNLFGKKTIATTAVIVFCFILYVFFPADTGFQILTKDLFLLFLIPFLYIKFILKKNNSVWGERRKGILWGIAMFASSSALAYVMISYTDFLEYYKISALEVDNFWVFILNSLLLAGILLFFQEYFFRKFILDFLSPLFSSWAIWIQVAAFAVLAILVSGGVNENLWQLSPYLILSATNGITAYKSKSIVYSWTAGLVFLYLFNAYLVHYIKTA